MKDIAVEFRIPISPNENYMRMLQYFIESTLEFGGEIVKNAQFIASVSRDAPKIDLTEQYSWVKDYNLSIRWMDEELFDELEYDGTGIDRFYVQSNCDIVIMCDVDILIANNLDEIIIQSFEQQKQLGMIAHVSPFLAHPGKTSEQWWKEIFSSSNLSAPKLDNLHTIPDLSNSEDITSKLCPYYFNYGFIVAPRQHFDKMSKSYLEDVRCIDKNLDTFFKSQIANCLGYEKHDIDCDQISYNYNFPLHIEDRKVRKHYPLHESRNFASDICVFHYLGNGEFNKNDFKTESSLLKALNRVPTNESAKTFQQKLKTIYFNINEKETHAQDLVIITGHRRSGTTLLNATICSNNNANELGQEAQFLTRLIESYKWSKDNFYAFGQSYFNSLESLTECYQKMVNTLINSMRGDNSLLVLKNPELSFVLEEAIALLPNAKFVITTRNPLDQICSELDVIRRRKKDDNLIVTEKLITTLIESYNKYDEKLLLLKEFVLPVCYEDLVKDFDNVIRCIESNLDIKIPFDKQAKWGRVGPHADLFNSPSTSMNYGEKITCNSVDRFKTDLTEQHCSLIEKKTSMSLWNEMNA